MTTDVRLFTDKGVFQMPDTTGLSDADIALIAAVRSAYEAERVAAEAVEQCRDRLHGHVSQLADAENYLKDHYPPITFHQLWKQTVGKV